MNLTEAREKLKGITVNIFQKPVTREQFEGSAKVKKVLSFDTESKLARCRVKFKQNGFVAERFIFIGN